MKHKILISLLILILLSNGCVYIEKDRYFSILKDVKVEVREDGTIKASGKQAPSSIHETTALIAALAILFL